MSLSQLKDYLRATSPLSKLQNSNKMPLKQIHNSIDAKLSLMREKPKNYQSPYNKLKRNKLLTMSTQEKGPTEEYSQMKASSIIYNIPELSPPQINFQVSDQLRHRINEIKSEIVTKLPSIKSSQFSSNKLQSVFSRRIVLKDLQTWLQEKLKDPPLTHQDSIQYKNMIMGIGMKEVIRLIGTRCIQQANFVNQVWELTWSICREIILYLSKRAHKCEKILMEQTSFFRQGCELKIKTTENELKETKEQNQQLKSKNQKLNSDITSLRKKNKQLKLTKFNIESSFNELKEQFENVFKQNLLLHMRMSPNDHAKREYLKKKLRLFMDDKKKNKSIFKQFLDRFMKQNNISIEQQEFDQRQLTLEINRYKSLQSKRNLQIQQELYERFKNSDKQTQTPIIKLQDKVIETTKVEKNEKMTQTTVAMKEQYGMVTEIISQDAKKSKVKKDKSTKKTELQKKKEKQKEKTKLKLQQKTSIISSTGKQNTEASQQQKQAVSTQDKMQLSYEKSRKKARQQPTLDSKKVLQNNKYQFIQQEIEQQGKCQISYFAKQKIKQIKMKTNQQIKQQKNYEEQKKIHNQEVEQIIKQKQNKIEQLKAEMVQKQIRYSTQLKQLKAQIEKSNSTPSFSQQTQSPRLINQTLTEPFLLQFKQKQKEIDKQDLYLLQLIKNKDYQQLLQVIKDKRYIQQSLSLNNFSKRDSSSFQQQVFNSPQRQIPKFRGSKIVKKNGIESFLNSYGTNKCIDNQDLVQEIDAPVFYNKKMSKRSSTRSKTNMLNDLKMVKTDVQQGCQQSKPGIKMQPISFAEACTNYLYHISPVENNNSNKQAGLSDYTKKLLRDQYREIHRQVIEGNHVEKNEKQIRTVVEKGLSFILKQLCKQFQLAQKQGLDRIQQIKISYTSLPLIMTNRFNLNFGVKKVASKHIKDFLVCLKGSKKFTEKYSIIAYFMLNATSLTNNICIFQYQQAQLLFFFILLINIMDGMTSDHIINKAQAQSIAELCKKYLTRDQNLTEYVRQLPLILQAQNINNFVNFYKKLIKKYEQVSRERLEQNEVIYQVLHRKFKDGKQGIKWIDFINFISIFNVKRKGQKNYTRLHSSIVNTIIQIILQQKNSQNNKLITHQCFMKFVVKCPEFSYQNMSIYIESYTQLADFDFSTEQSKQKVLKLSQQNQLCGHISKKLSKKEYLTQPQTQFWLKYVLVYSLQNQIDNILGNLLSGVLDPRTKQVVLGNCAQSQTVQSQ